MVKFIALLKFAHAVEIGAYHAYEGHWNSLSYRFLGERSMIRKIQQEEEDHRQEVRDILNELGYNNSPILDFMLYLIGKSISISCYVIPKGTAMWGAKIMEVMGSDIYKRLAKEARDQGYPAMGVTFDYMQRAEEQHEFFFKQYLGYEEVV